MDLSAFTANNKNSAVIKSAVPDVAKSNPCMLGVDEAGRGPVLGPMVYGIAYCPVEFEEDLKRLGFAGKPRNLPMGELMCLVVTSALPFSNLDSKTLTEEKREELVGVMEQHSESLGWMVEVISPTVICNHMLNMSKYSLNAISHDSAIGLIKQALDDGVCVTEVYVDTVGPPEKYQAKLQDIFPDIKITVAKKADSTFPIVSAASICAKVARDCAIQTWRFPEGLNFNPEEYGSGYPNDPATKKFLSAHVDNVFGFPSLVRFSWSTAEKLLEDNAATVSWDEDAEKATQNNIASIQSFFKRDPNHTAKVAPKESAFFVDRALAQVSDL